MYEKSKEELKKQFGKLCISILFPSDIKSYNDLSSLDTRVKSMINQAKSSMKADYGKEIIDHFSSSFEGLAKQITTSENNKGIGLYVSEEFALMVPFPFTVKEEIKINNFFDLELISKAVTLSSLAYAVVVLSRGRTRLIMGKGIELKEVFDENFPHEFKEEFQVQRTSKNGLYSDEESKINQARIDSYFRESEHLIHKYTKNKPLIICGLKENIAKYQIANKDSKDLLFTIEGDYDKTKIHEITEILLPKLEVLLEENHSPK